MSGKFQFSAILIQNKAHEMKTLETSTMKWNLLSRIKADIWKAENMLNPPEDCQIPFPTWSVRQELEW
jgi:hypothetical protein